MLTLGSVNVVKAMKFTPDSVRKVRDHLMEEVVSLMNYRMAAFSVTQGHCMGLYEEWAKVLFTLKVLEGGSLELFVPSAKNYGKDWYCCPYRPRGLPS